MINNELGSSRSSKHELVICLVFGIVKIATDMNDSDDIPPFKSSLVVANSGNLLEEESALALLPLAFGEDDLTLSSLNLNFVKEASEEVSISLDPLQFPSMESVVFMLFPPLT